MPKYPNQVLHSPDRSARMQWEDEMEDIALVVEALDKIGNGLWMIGTGACMIAGIMFVK